MVKEKVLFWDVDTQFDFLRPEGGLYVPGAEEIIDNISQTRKLALENGYSILASMDWHSLDDEEISLEPDFRNTFPPHCIASEPGCERVGYLGQLPIEYVEVERVDNVALAKLVDKEQFHVVIRTNSVDVFKNPNVAEVLNLVAPQKVVVFGVALDMCVRYAVEGLLSWGKCDIILLEDVVKGLGIIEEQEVLREFKGQGVEIKRLNELRKEL